jgi:hypothetical protein
MQGGHNDGFMITKGYTETLRTFINSIMEQ